jgi:peptidoglycan/LPS O-acetylase OafA/YrhL
MYWFACILYLVVGTLYTSIWLPPTPFNLVNVLANAFFLNGLYLPAVNYLPPGGWSVGDEMVFYLIIPFLFLNVRSLRKALVVLLFAIIASMMIQIVLFYIVVNFTSYDWYTYRDWAFYFWFPNQFPVFCFGILLYFFLKNNSIIYQEWMILVPLTIYFLLGLFPFDLNFPYNLIQPEYIYSIVFFGFSYCMSKTKLTFLLRPMNKLGQVSFSAYLVHFLVIEFGIWISKISFGHSLNEHVHFILLYLFTIVTTYFISRFTFENLEKRGIAMGERVIHQIASKTQVQKDVSRPQV